LVSVVVVVDVVGATGCVLDDCSVVLVVFVTLLSLQPASKTVPEASAKQIRNLRPDFLSIMRNSLLVAFRETAG
jgi:hypothetical protein